MSHVTTKARTVTPATAQKWLDNKADNRPIKWAWVQLLASMILNGEWELNGETIKFNEDGGMIDGQHRCLAVIKADSPIRTFVTTGLNEATFDTIDRGAKRSISDVLSKYGEVNCTTLAGAISWLWRYRCGLMQQQRFAAPTPKESRDILANNPTLRDSVMYGRACRQMIAPSLGTCLHFLFAEKDDEEAGRFMELLASGEGLTKSNPATCSILQLRQRLIDNRKAKARMSSHDIAPVTIKAWNLTREKRTVRNLAHRSRGEGAEDFPVIV